MAVLPNLDMGTCVRAQLCRFTIDRDRDGKQIISTRRGRSDTKNVATIGIKALTLVRNAPGDDLCLRNRPIGLHRSSCCGGGTFTTNTTSVVAATTTGRGFGFGWELGIADATAAATTATAVVRLIDGAYRSVGGSLRRQQRWNRLGWRRTKGGVAGGVGDILGTSLSIHHACDITGKEEMPLVRVLLRVFTLIFCSTT